MMTALELADLLATVPEVNLEGLKLLRNGQREPGRLFPTGLSREQMSSATIELINYARSCKQLGERLMKLPPRPIVAPIPEVGL